MDRIDRYDPDVFGFLGPPFAVPAGGDLLLTLPQEDVLSATLNALDRGTGLVLIAGDAGSGRTLVADALADALRTRGLVVDQIAQAGASGSGALLGRLAPLLGIAPSRLALMLAALAATPDATDARDAVARALAAGRAGPGGGAGGGAAGVIDRDQPDRTPGGRRAGGRLAGEARPARPLAVVVDDAGTWPEADLLQLVSLAGLRVGDAPLLRAVLIGDAVLERRFATLRDMAAGVAGPAGGDGDGPDAVSLRIPPLTLRQGEEYLAHRFAAAGGSLERTMSPGAVGEILLRCGGNPGRIDQLADDCLAITARRRRRTVTAAVVRAARQLPRERRRLWGPAAYALLGAAGGVLATGAGLALVLHSWTQAAPGLAGAPGQAPGQGDPALFAGAGRFGAPAPAAGPPEPASRSPAAPRPYTQDYPAQGFAPAPPRAEAALPPPALPPPARPRLSAVPPAPVPGTTTFPATPAVPRVGTAGGDAVPFPALPPQVVLAPVPVAPPLATVDVPRQPGVPPLSAAVPATIRAPGTLAVADAAPPMLPPAPAWPAQAGIAAGPRRPPGQEAPAAVEAVPAPDTARAPGPAIGPAPSRATAGAPLPLPPERPARAAAPDAPAVAAGRAALPGRRDGPVVTHVARGRDTTAVLLRRIWGSDEPAARALFRSLNPGLDADGPWPAGTVVVVPQRLRSRPVDAVAARPEAPRLPVPPRPGPEVVRDNPAGQVRTGVPYFCRSILPQNGAEDAYTRQVCGR